MSLCEGKEQAMNWPKDRKKAFLWVAKAFGTPYDRRTKKQKEVARYGICYAISKLTGSKMIYWWAYQFADDVSIVNEHWWTIRNFSFQPRRCDKERSLFCYLMATLTDKEFEEISG